MQVLTRLGILLSLAAPLAGEAQASTEALPDMHFQVRDPATREVFFQGYEKQSDSGSGIHKETYYYDTAQKEVLVEDAQYQKDSLSMDSYVSRSALTGEETIMKTEGKRIKIRYRPDTKASFQDTSLTAAKDTIHSKVFDDLIARNWEGLQQGNTLKFDLVLPFRLESRGFQIAKDRVVRAGTQELVVLALKPQNLLLRAFVPKMEFYYAPGPKPQLKIFSGPSVLPIRGESNRMVEVVYSRANAAGS